MESTISNNGLSKCQKHNRLNFKKMKEKISSEILEKASVISPFSKRQVQTDINNLNKWRLEAPSQMLKKLNDEAAESDDRYRNIDKPFPLL